MPSPCMRIQMPVVIMVRGRHAAPMMIPTVTAVVTAT